MIKRGFFLVAFGCLASNANTLEKLPPEITKYILSNTGSARAILDACSASKAMLAFCAKHENDLWKGLVERDFGPGPYFEATEAQKDMNAWKAIYVNNFTLSQKNAKYLLENKILSPEKDGKYLVGVNLSEKDLNDAVLDEADLRKANLSKAQFQRTWFRYANLTGANMSATNFTSADFGYAVLDSADLSKSILTDANFFVTDLIGTNCTDAHLTSANFEMSDVRDTNFTKADLTNAEFIGFTISKKTNFSEAILTGTTFRNGEYIDATGKKVPMDWKIE